MYLAVNRGNKPELQSWVHCSVTISMKITLDKISFSTFSSFSHTEVANMIICSLPNCCIFHQGSDFTCLIRTANAGRSRGSYNNVEKRRRRRKRSKKKTANRKCKHEKFMYTLCFRQNLKTQTWYFSIADYFLWKRGGGKSELVYFHRDRKLKYKNCSDLRFSRRIIFSFKSPQRANDERVKIQNSELTFRFFFFFASAFVKTNT